MKSQWLKSVVETSKQAAAPMPFHRGRRQSARRSALLKAVSAA